MTEALEKEGKQAAAIVLRETYPGYLMPLGVWNVRESIRTLMKQRFRAFDTFKGALWFALGKMKIPREKWVASSVLISRELTQTKITSY